RSTLVELLDIADIDNHRTGQVDSRHADLAPGSLILVLTHYLRMTIQALALPLNAGGDRGGPSPTRLVLEERISKFLEYPFPQTDRESLSRWARHCGIASRGNDWIIPRTCIRRGGEDAKGNYAQNPS